MPANSLASNVRKGSKIKNSGKVSSSVKNRAREKFPQGEIVTSKSKGVETINHLTGKDENLKVTNGSKAGFPLLFTGKRKTYIEGYIRDLLVILRLQDWTITLDWSISKDHDVYATIISNPDQKRATLNLTIKFLELDNKERSQTLVHELMHCHLFALHYLTEKSIEQACSKKVSEMFLVGFDCEIEKATDAIADVLAPFVPKFTLPV